MKQLILLMIGLFVASNVYAQKSSVLITGFDPFGSSSHNNSRIVAKALVSELQSSYPQYTFEFCELRTVYDLAQEDLIDCYHSMKIRPKFIISLGEGNSNNIVLETRGHNLDISTGSDNDGIIRQGEVISSEHPQEIGSTIEWNKAYCKLRPENKKLITLSNDPGNFVCNNTIFRMSAFNPEIRFGFVHVPSYRRLFNSRRVIKAKRLLKSIVLNLLKNQTQMHSSYPTNKEKILQLIKTSKSQCDKQFYRTLLQQY